MDLHNPRNPYGSSEDVAVFDIFTWAVGACLEAEECHLAPMGLSQSSWSGITVISLTHTTVRTILQAMLPMIEKLSQAPIINGK